MIPGLVKASVVKGGFSDQRYVVKANSKHVESSNDLLLHITLD